MTSASRDRHDDPGLPRVDQGHPGGDLGRDHQARVDRPLRLRRDPEFDLRPGQPYVVHPGEGMREFPDIPDDIIDGEILEADPPRRLSMTWRMLMDPQMQAEGFTKLTYEIEETESAGTRLTVIHELEGAPTLGAMVRGAAEAEGAGGGWGWVLSDLKSLLETGKPLAG